MARGAITGASCASWWPVFAADLDHCAPRKGRRGLFSRRQQGYIGASARAPGLAATSQITRG